MAKQKEQYKLSNGEYRTRLMKLTCWVNVGPKLKLQLDQLHADLNRKVQAKMIRKKGCHDRGTKLHKFKIWDNMYLKNFHRGD